MRNESDFLPAAEVGDRLGVSTRRVYQLAHARLLPCVRRGRRILIPRLAFEQFIQHQNRLALGSLGSAGEEVSHGE